jgi:hypothetical protein
MCVSSGLSEIVTELLKVGDEVELAPFSRSSYSCITCNEIDTYTVK